MKIGSSDEITKYLLTETAKKTGTAAGKFGEILSETMEGSRSGDTVSPKIAAGAGMAPISMNPILSGVSLPLIDRVDHFLNTLDEYRQKLGDHRFSLKEIDPLVRKLETEKENLMPGFQSLSDTDELKGILDETLIAASLEVVRFNRGDYIT